MDNKKLRKEIFVFILFAILFLLLFDSFINFIPETKNFRLNNDSFSVLENNENIFIYSKESFYVAGDKILYNDNSILKTGEILDIKIFDISLANEDTEYLIKKDLENLTIIKSQIIGKIKYPLNNSIFYILLALIIGVISFLLTKLLKKVEFIFMNPAETLSKKFTFLKNDLELAGLNINEHEYLTKSLVKTFTLFLFLIIITTIISVRLGNNYLGLIISILISIFDFVRRLNYPKLYANRRIQEVDKNLLPALRTILIQINSGVALFDVFVSISKSDYGEISNVFSKMVKKINTGTPQIKALEEITQNNPSPFFRKSIWQLINGMKSGSNISNVLKNIIDSLSKEQVIQIEKYGSQLNPLAMFYMLLVVIMPALSITFITVISSFISSVSLDSRYVLAGLFIIILIFQITFLGIIKTKRPSLLEE